MHSDSEVIANVHERPGPVLDRASLATDSGSQGPVTVTGSSIQSIPFDDTRTV